MLYSPNLNALIIGDQNGSLIQFDLSDGRSQMKQVKQYRDFFIGSVRSSALLGNLAFFGGYKSFMVIDLKSRQKVGVWTTAIYFIYFMGFHWISESKLILCIGGKYADYSDSKSDLLDITNLAKAYGINSLTKK